MSPKVQTRAARTRRQALIKAGVWIFLILFGFTVVGVAMISIKSSP